MTPIFDIKELIALMRAGTSEEAIPHLEYITQKLPTHVAAHALLAQAYTNEGRLGEAKLAWQNALFLMPNSPSIKKGFRRVLKELYRQHPPVPSPVEPGVEQQPQHVNGQLEVAEEEAPPIEESGVTPQENEPTGLEEQKLVPENAESVASPVEAPEAQSQDIGTEESLAEERDAEDLDVVTEVPLDEQLDTQDLDTVAEVSLDEQLDTEDLDPVIGALFGEEKDTEDSDAPTGAPVVEDYMEGTDQAPSHSEETPSMLVNPSSHHDVTPVEIEAISPKDLGTPDIEEEDEIDALAEIDDIPLPVITVPTPNPTPTNPPASHKPHIPPILAPLVQNSDEWIEDQELDHLIEELESARIIPKPDHEHIEAPVLEDNVDDMVSETLARIFEGQKQYGKAADMYEKLATIHPERTKKFVAKAAELRALLSSNSEEANGTTRDES